MPLYRIERPLGAATPEEVDAASFRAMACIPHFTGMAWLRSYYDTDTGRMTCYYQAERPQDIRRHAQMAHIPCESVAAVVEYLPDAYR